MAQQTLDGQVGNSRKVRRIFCISAHQGSEIYAVWAEDEEPSDRGNERDEFTLTRGGELDCQHAIPGRTSTERYITQLTEKYKREGFEVKTSLAWCPSGEGEFIEKYM